MSHITDPPLDHPGRAGHDFNYAVWTAGTSVTLCNVPWNSDYRDIVNFTSDSALDTYLTNNSGPTVHIDNLTYAAAGRPVRIALPFNDAYRFNYLRVHNPAQPVGESGPRTFYYFIRDVRFVAPNTTELDIQLDVWQTFRSHVQFGNCYVERGHLGIANENQFNDNGREYLTIPEGLDIGGEYMVRGNYTHTLADIQWSDTGGPAAGGFNYNIIMATTVSIDGSGGNTSDPKLSTATGSRFEGLPNGAELYYFETPTEFRNFISQNRERPWMTQGIISIYAVPPIPASDLQTETVYPEGVGDGVKRLLDFRVKPQKISLRDDWRDQQIQNLPSRYRHLRKFLTYPYTIVELTTYSGTPLILKPEGMDGDDLEVVILNHLAPPAPRIVVYPYRYNNGGVEDWNRNGVVFNDSSEFLDMVTGIFNLPTFSTVNNSYMSFMASNANSIAYQHSQADWSQQRALAGNQVAYDQASQNIGLTRQMTELGIGAASARTDLANTTGGYRALQGAAGGLIGGLGGGAVGIGAGAIGAASQGISHAIDVNHRNNELAINSNLARSQTRAQTGTAGFMRDTNKDFADFAATGDYEMSIAAINAKVQDARMIQPTTSGQMGGDAFNLAQYQWAVHAKVKTLQRASMHAIGEFWLRYGYAVNRFARMVQLDVMSKFTYWKLKETYITSSTCPEAFRQAIRGIFEKGVTVWKNPDDIGNIDIADNEPLAGVSL